MYIQTLKVRELFHTYELQKLAQEGSLPAPYQDQITSSPVEDVIAHFKFVLRKEQKKGLEDYRKKLWKESVVFMDENDYIGKMVEVERNKYRGKRGLVIAHDNEKGIALVLLRETMHSVWLDVGILEFQPFSKGERGWFKTYEGEKGVVVSGVEVRSNIDGEVYRTSSSSTSKLNYRLVNCTNSKGRDVWVCVKSLDYV
jgi:hypothetical protein